MPTYEFRCKRCRHEFTTLMSISDHDRVMARVVQEHAPKKLECPQCKSTQIEQQLDFAYAKTSKKSF